jgi:putative ABC transport system ATP-binding protein
MSSPSSLLSARDLGRRHPGGDSWLFHDFDLDLESGDRLALVGPTGSGKSLILRALALLDPVDSGEVFWRGLLVPDADVPSYRRQVTYLQQRSPLVPGTVEENLRVPFDLQERNRLPFPRDEALHLLETFGAGEDFLAKKGANLSGGERQIVGLLRAFLAQPTVLLLDEPTASLDRDSAASVEALVLAWQAEAPDSRTYLWVSHDPEQVVRVADRALKLARGRLEEST